MSDADAELVTGGVGRHVADVLRHELHGVASVAVGAAVAFCRLRRGTVNDGNKIVSDDDAVLAFPVLALRYDGLFDDLHGNCPYTRKSIAAGLPSRVASWH